MSRKESKKRPAAVGSYSSGFRDRGKLMGCLQVEILLSRAGPDYGYVADEAVYDVRAATA